MPHDPLDLEPGALPWDHVTVRTLRADDLARVVAIDAPHAGRRRQEYYAAKLKSCLEAGGVHLSLAAEVDGQVVGFLLAQVYFGEFGMMEPTAIIDSLGVDRAAQGRQAGTAMLEQLVQNLRALNVERLITYVGWDQMELLRFLHARGFAPGQQLCLERRIGNL